MNDLWLRRCGWATAALAITILASAAVALLLAVDLADSWWSGNLVATAAALGAPILGVIIVAQQPRNRVGWLFIAYGLLIGLRSLGAGIYLLHGAQPTGYSGVEYFFLWVTEPANLGTLVCVILLMLWFPDGQLPSRRWRVLYVWLLLALTVLLLGTFSSGPDWNGGAAAGGIVIDNPYGWLALDATHPAFYFGFPAFLSLVLITILAALSLVFRYRAAGQVVRLQLRWFVIGGAFSVVLLFFAIAAELWPDQNGGGFEIIRNLVGLMGQATVAPLYLAVGMAILRYRLYDIDVIIRRTLVYTLLTGLLALLFFGSVILLQRGFEAVTGQQSQVAIVLSTLAIAALFNPLRTRIQGWIDRRFYRKKYDAQQVLARFAITARDETDMNALTAELARIVDETLHPEGVRVWLRKTGRPT